MFGFVLRLIIAAVIIWQGLKKKRKGERRREEIRRLVRLAQEEAEIAESQRIKTSEESLAKAKACSVCYFTPTTISCARCKVPHYSSAKCEITHWRQGHKYECVDETDDKSIRPVTVSEPAEVVNRHEKDATNKRALEQGEERVRHLEEELSKSKKEISLLQSECSNWSIRTSFVSRRLSNFIRESDENQSKCAEARRELLEEKELVRRLKLELEEITTNSNRKVEEVRVAERKKQEKYIQKLKTERVELRRELEQERKQRLQLQIGKSKVEKLSQELANAHKNVELAENGWKKAQRELEEERELVRLVKMECEEIRQSSITQMEKKELQLTNALNAAATAQGKLSDLEREINSFDDKACAICLSNEKDVAFGCGHMTCRECMLTISNCHICREPISSRLRLFPG